jgi:pimeloyl-ACP methyl ester carboxylesterase
MIFVLVHGAWHGGWCWRRVSDMLQEKGHKVLAPTLTGLGERSHLMSKDIVLDTHIADIVNVIQWEDLADICLVAHSYGGWPVSGAIEQVLDRISSVIYLDAFVPEDGQRGFDFASEFSRKAMMEAMAKGAAASGPPKAEIFQVNEKDRAGSIRSSRRSPSASPCIRSSSQARARRWRRKFTSARRPTRSPPSISTTPPRRRTRRGAPMRSTADTT